MTNDKTNVIDISLAVDFGNMPPADAQLAADEIRKAVAKFGRPHIKIIYQTLSHCFDQESKSRTVEVTTKTIGTTSIGEAIVEAMGISWNTGAKQ
jgi:hypothetical protein